MNDPEITDSPFMGPVAGEQYPTLRRIDDHDGVLGVLGRLRGTGRGQDTVLRRLWAGRRGSHPKAAFNAFAMLHRLGDQRLSPE